MLCIVIFEQNNRRSRNVTGRHWFRLILFEEQHKSFKAKSKKETCILILHLG
jgi:hypothetical protein